MLSTRPLSTGTLAQGCFALAIILLPFNDLPYLESILGEMSREAAFYPLAIGLALWVIDLLHGDRIELARRPSALLLCAFMVWVVASIALNLPRIVSMETKGRTGAEKAILQIVLLSFTSLAAAFAYRATSRQEQPLALFRRYVLISFIIAGSYSILEIASILGVSAARGVILATNVFLHNDPLTYTFGRIRSVSGEASWFAMYCGIAFPWLLSYVFTERRRLTLHLAIVMYLVALLVLSWSRTAYVITLVQLMLFVGAVVFQGDRGPARRRVVALVAGGAVALVAGTIALRETLARDFSITTVFTSLTSSNNVSNLARIGSQLTAFRIGAENPAFGVGLGEYGFHMRSHVPIWAQASSEIQKWMSIEEGTRWPPVHSLYARLAAETGLPGLALWTSLWLVLLAGCYRTYRRRSRALGCQDVLGLALMVSMVGAMLSQLNIDSFRIFGYWLTLALGWAYTARYWEASAGEPEGLSISTPTADRIPHRA